MGNCGSSSRSKQEVVPRSTDQTDSERDRHTSSNYDNTASSTDRPLLPRYAKLETYFELVCKLGDGQFGTVDKMINKKDRSLVAVKRTRPTPLDYLDHDLYTREDVQLYCQEVRALLKCQTVPHTLQLKGFFWNGRDLDLVTEILGLNLREWISRQHVFTESQVRQVAQSVLKGLDYLHKMKIVHRDIKEENIMFERPDDLTSLKIVDFGFAKDLSECRTTDHFCGSRGYLAPEIHMEQQYGVEVDMFAFGVMLFRVFSDHKPFPSTPSDVNREATLQLQYHIDEHDWRNTSNDARDLVRCCLSYRDNRITAADALCHPWVRQSGGSILRTSVSDTFPGSNARTYSRAVLMAEPRQSTLSIDSQKFWMGEPMQDVLKNLISNGCFHGNILNSAGDFIMVEEYKDPRAVILPHYIARLPRYTELECRELFREIVQRVRTFHQAGVAHRNLNPSNVVIETDAGNPYHRTVCLRGIQYAQLALDGRPITGRIGRARSKFDWYAYVAPEIDTDFMHDDRVDLWSLGTLLFNMLCGTGPFTGTPEEIVNKKSIGRVDWAVFRPSPKARSLVKALLHVQPSRRPSLNRILEHPWLTEADDALERWKLDLALAVFSDYDRRANP